VRQARTRFAPEILENLLKTIRRKGSSEAAAELERLISEK
jgi:hypothetical protein